MSKSSSTVGYPLLVSLCFLLPLGAHSQVDPSIHWLSLDLPHFELIYDAQYQDLAKDYARALESSYQTLAAHYPTAPSKTVVVLNDNTDLTNGFATVLPYPMIQVFPVLPASSESIGQYGNWSREIILHEYTHILALSQQRDWISGFSYVFGSLMHPNVLMPRWWNEGLAVESETRYSNHGRLRSTDQDAFLRTQVLHEALSNVDLAQANEVSIPTWPYGSRPYLYGSLLWSQATAEKGPEIGGKLAWQHGGRSPYFINSPAEDILGQDYSDFWDHDVVEVQRRAKFQIETLSKVPQTETESLNLSELESFAPVLSPDGLKLAFIAKDKTTRRSLRVLQRPNGQTPFAKDQTLNSLLSLTPESSSENKAPIPHLLNTFQWPSGPIEDDPVTGTLSRLDWSPDSKTLVYDRVDIVDRYHTVSDLYLFTIEDAKSKRLSRGIRGREPAFSPDGKSIAFIKLGPGRTKLQLHSLTRKSTVTMYEGTLNERIGMPVFLSDQDILFSSRVQGQEFFRVMNLNTKAVRTVLQEYTDVRFPTRVKDKILFTSSKNGVPNLYVSTLDFNSVHPITHVATGVFASTWDFQRNEYYVSELTAQGLQISRVQVPVKEAVELPNVKPLFEDRYPSKSEAIASSTDSFLDNVKPSDYSAGSYLLPRYWIPFYYWDAYSSYLSASTSASDPLGKHAWAASTMYDLTYGRLGYSLGYTNNSFPIEVQLQSTNVTYELPGAIAETYNSSKIFFDKELASISPYFYAGAGWTWLTQNLPTYGTNQSGPSMAVWDYEFRMNGAQISPESGWGFTANVTSFLAGLSKTTFNDFTFSFVKYLSSFLPHRHAVMTKFQTFIADQSIPIANYVSAISLAYEQNTASPQFIMRGYPTGTFEGRVMNQLTLEYRFPIADLYHGSGTRPFFWKRWSGAIVADGINLDGIAYNYNNSYYQVAKLSNSYWDVGAEAKLDFTLGYLFPITFYLGVYEPLEQNLLKSPNIGLGIYL